MKNKIFLGAESAITPLGKTALENFKTISDNKSGITLFKNAGFNKEDIFLSKIGDLKENRFQSLIESCLADALSQFDETIISSPKSILILSTTKAGIDKNIFDAINIAIGEIKTDLKLFHDPLVVCHACTSGVQAINLGADLIKAGKYNNAIIIGCDIISDFVLYGFQSLFAISDMPCAPFDGSRKGLTLGEAAAIVVLSKEKNIFSETPVEYISGSSSNDANHISGPSRTGEGLYLSVLKTLKEGKIGENEIDFISAHGTATVYNDEMESIAFDRLKINHVPLNSFKGYFGHTLGAAGVLETVMSIQSLRNNLLIKSIGYDIQGTSKDLNILRENKSAVINTILKTASGFGGANASLIIKRT